MPDTNRYAGTLEYLKSGSRTVERDDLRPDHPPTRRPRGSKARRPRTSAGAFPVEVRNIHDGTHEGVREAAFADAAACGVDPSEVRATGPARFEFIIR